MDLEVTVAFIPDGIDVEAGLTALDDLEDRVLLERAGSGLLGWGWSMPGEEAPSPPWAHDAELAALVPWGDVPVELEGRFLAAARQSLVVGLRNAAMLLAGEDAWFESRVVTRVPLASGGEMVLFPDDDAGVGDSHTYSDIARLPIDVLPEIGRAMGVHGPGSVAIHVHVTG